MATFTKNILSGSTNGRAILVTATASSGTIIHTGSTSTSVQQEVWMYAHNADTTARKLTIEFGGTTAPNDLIEQTIPAESGLTLVSPGLILKGTATALVIRAFAATASQVSIFGYTNDIS